MVLSRLTKITGPGVATDTNWVGNNADFTGITTTATSFNIGVTTIHSNLIEAHNIKSTGIITATGGSFSGNVTAVDGTFTGNVSIAGTLTYEDVTNVDSVGIVTAAAVDVDDFLDVGSNIKLGNAGVITATSFVGSGAALTGIDATAIKDSGGNVKIQAQASGAIHSGVSTFQDIDVDGHTNLDNVSIAGVTTIAHTGANQLVIKDSDTSGTGSHMRISFQDSGGTEKFFVGNNNNNDYLYIGSGAGQPNPTVIRYANSDKLTVENSRVYINTSLEVVGSITAADSIIHQGDTNTKIRFPANDTIRFETAGSQRLNINSSGNVSITNDLDVDGHTNLDNVSVAGVVTATTFVGNGDFVELDVDGHTNLDNVSVAGVSTFTGNIDANGNLDVGGSGGITISNSGADLTMNSAGSIFTGNGGNATDPIVANVSDTNTGFFYPAADTLAVTTAGSERLRIGSNGLLTVNATTYDALTINTTENGTNGPQVQLTHISASPAAGDYVGQLRFSGKDSAGNTDLYSRISTVIDDPTSGQETAHLQFSTRGYSSFNPILRLKNRGTASAPSYTADDINGIILDVYNTGNPYPRYMNFIAKAGGNTDSNIGFWTEAVGGSPTEKLRITSDGKCVVGNNSGAGYNTMLQVHASGDTLFSLNSTSGGAKIKFYETGTGRFNLETLNGSGGLMFYDATSGAERLRINSSGSLLTPNGSPLTSKGSNSQQNGGYEVYNDQHLIETNDSTNSFHVMREWKATKFGEFRVEAEMMIVAGSYYFIYDVYNSTRGERISAAGTGNDTANGVNASRWVDHLDSGFGSSVHGMRRFTVRCGQNYPVQPGDTIQLRMASSTGSGGLVTGNGQGLRCEHLQIFNDTPDLETGGRGFQPSAVAFHVVMNGSNQSFSGDLTWNNGYTAFNRGYRRSTVSGNPVNAGFDIANSRFIVPYTGIYAFYFNGFVNTTSDCRMAVTINGSAYQSGYIWGCNSSEGQATPNQAGFQTLYLGEGANIKLKIVSGTLSNTYGGHTSWGGWLIG